MKFKTFATISFLAFAMVFVQACGKKKDSSSTRVSGVPGVRGSDTAFPNQQHGGQYKPVGGSDIDRMSKVFLSPSIDPQYIGTISSGRVEIRGSIRVQQDGRVITQGSGIQLKFSDSFVGQIDPGTNQEIQPIETSFISLSGGTVYNGQVNLQFSDASGIIQIQGTWNQSALNGTITFQNNSVQPWTPGGLTGGTLGTFSTETCNFIVCQ